MGYNLFLIVRGLIELESIYKSRSKKGQSGEDPGGNYTVSMSTASEEAIMFPSGNVGLFPSKVGGEATSIGVGKLLPLAKTTYQDLGAQRPQLHQCLLTHPHSNFKDRSPLGYLVWLRQQVKLKHQASLIRPRSCPEKEVVLGPKALPVDTWLSGTATPG